MGTASDYFGAMVREYDSLIRRTVPRYDEMLERLLLYQAPGALRILELGCGTGNLSDQLLERHPGASLTVVDAAPEMVEATLQRLAPTGRQVSGICCRFEELPTDLGPFDLVTSTISLHHVEEKGPLYRSLHDLLESGGQLAFSDQLRGTTEAVHGVNWQQWIAFSRRPGGTTEEELQGLLDHAEAHDHYTPLPEQLELLGAAGFRGLDCVWRNWIWGVLVAERP